MGRVSDETKASLTRRNALRALAGLGLGAAAAGCGGGGEAGAAETPLSCVLTPEQIEGPFFLDTGLLRRDIAEGRAGTPLRLELRLARVDGDACAPLAGALVEAWHADADGVYSGYPESAGNPRDATGETFLRGYQVTDDRGVVEFRTVYPGWYPGRTVHVHLMVRVDATRVLTTQVYFPESDNDAVLSAPPYDARGERDTSNAADFLARGALDALTCAVSRDGDVYVARHGLGVAV